MTISGDATQFLDEYARRTNAHDVDAWSELIADEATYWFTNGTHRGKSAVVAAVAHNFRVIEDEVYEISNVEWIHDDGLIAVVRYRFAWQGTQDGVPARGEGRGTNVMTRRDDTWKMIHEHLSI